MRTKTFMLLSAILFSLAFVVISCDKSQSPNPQSEPLEEGLKSGNNGPSINGHGIIYWGGETKRQFTFHANTMPDGSVKGSGVLKYIGGELSTKFDIDCINIVSNAQAWVSGTITYSSTNPEYVGEGCYFKVHDGGEGQDGDWMTGFYPAVSYDCTVNNYTATFYELVSGNIQVKP